LTFARLNSKAAHTSAATEVDELGPVDWIVVEFPGSRFNGGIAPALTDLVDRDLIRVLDLLVLKKDADGELEAFELSDLEDSEFGGRMLRAAVIGPAPVVRAAATVATAAVVAHGVGSRMDRRDDRRDRRR
jgi:hypothetical protein